ncbi:hypothetical protein ACIBG8_16900 [Nonomuraea sp. NPDC050556]|uniref:hypothetical protein n=1 Tax=Nonomuraea sp. NPDC050556 TaxID=3364369 RepID=UPI00379D5F37
MRMMLWAGAAAITLLALTGCDRANSATAETASGSNSHDFAGRELSVDAEGSVRVKLEAGEEGTVKLVWKTRWTGWKHHQEAWDGDRMALSFDCAEDCAADYTIAVPPGTLVKVSGAAGPVPCPEELNCTQG